MGGSSKKQTIGYKYYVGMHMILCHGPVDYLYGITVAEKSAWSGSISNGILYINNEELFGGEKREGGILGIVDFESGGPTQGQNSYLAGLLGPLVPNFRGMCGVVLRRMYIGLNPYPKTWNFKVSRVHKRQNGIVQWYDAKSAISSIGTVGTNEETQIVPYNDSWEYITNPTATSPVGPGADYSGGFSGSIGTAPFGNTTHTYDDNDWGFPSPVATFVDIGTTIWIKKTIISSAASCRIRIKFDNIPKVWINGVNVTTSFLAIDTWVMEAIFTNLGTFEIIVACWDSTPADYNVGNKKYLSVIVSDLNQTHTAPDMNPAHIIRECLTDPDWGMGYPEGDIDDTSFISAANTLYSEGMGISILWETQSSIEEFIKLIIKHIDAALFVDIKTGKFVLKLIRNDYSLGSLITLNENNIDKILDFARPQFGELTTSVTVTYWDASTGKDGTLTIADSALAQMQNCTINTSIQYPGFTNAVIASRIAQRDLKTLSTPLSSCTIYTNRDAKDLNIGSVFKLTWPDYDLNETVMRVTGIGFGDGKSNKIRLQCIEDCFSTPLASESFIPYTPSAWVDPIQPPIATTIRQVFETPYLELVQILGQDVIDGKLATEPNLGYLGVAAGRPAREVNAEIYTDNGAGYIQRNSLDFSPVALLDGAIEQMVTTFLIDNGKDLNLIEIGTWVEVDDEIMEVVAISNTSLTVKRGCLDTLPAVHIDNAPLVFWDNYAEGDQIDYVTSDSINVKILTVTGSGVLSLADAPVNNVVMGARAIRPYPPANIKISGSYYPSSVVDLVVSVTWVHRNRLQQTANLVGFTEASITAEVGTTYSIRYYNNTTSQLLHSVDNLTGGPYSSFPSFTGTYVMRLEIWSVRSGYASFQKFSHIFTVINITRLTTEVGSTERLLTEAGDFITTE